jgi:hypothetical protein
MYLGDTKEVTFKACYVYYKQYKGERFMGKKALIVVLFLLMSFAHYNNFSLAAKDVDYFNEVINVTDGRVTEFGIRASFEIYEDGEGYCLQLLNKLHINNACISVIKEEKFYSVEFNNNGLKGYIENTSYDNHNVVTLNIVQYDSRNGLQELKNMIINAVGKAEDEVRYFEYLKAQINCNDKAKVTVR